MTPPADAPRPDPRMGRMPDATPGGWDWRKTQHNPPPDHTPRPDATETDNPVVMELLGPDGAPLRQWRERPTVRFGYQPRDPS